jgi:hypothetical protein
LRDGLLKLADEYAAHASAQETDTAARQADPPDQGDAGAALGSLMRLQPPE